MSDRTSPAEKKRIVYAMLRKAAEMGDECPSNNVLCAAIDATSVGTPSVIVSKLEAEGLIKVDRGRRWRRVTIVETGKSTASYHTPGHLVEANQRRRSAAYQRRERFADLVAEHGTVTAAARAMGISQQRGSQIWKRILQDMGEA